MQLDKPDSTPKRQSENRVHNSHEIQLLKKVIQEFRLTYMVAFPT